MALAVEPLTPHGALLNALAAREQESPDEFLNTYQPTVGARQAL